MCDNKNSNNLNTGIGFLAGAVVGALVGAAAVVLLNPTTGPENRRKIAATAKRYSEKGEELLDEAAITATKVKEASQPYVQQAVDKIGPYAASAAAKMNGQNNTQTPSDYDFETDSAGEQIQMLVDEPQDKAKKPTSQKNKKYFKKT